MKGCLNSIVVVIGLIVAAIVCWMIFYPTIHIRYRLTVEVQDGDEIKTGSSVVDVSYEIDPDSFSSFGPPNAFPRHVGYAPTVDLGKKGLLFLTFLHADRSPTEWIERNKQVSCSTDDFSCLPFAAFHIDIGPTYSQQKAALYELRRQSGSRDLPFAALPELACLSDINDPNSYVPVSPPYDLGACFGTGVELKRVTLQLTDDPITPRPDIWPQWLKEKGRMSAVLKGYHND